MKEQLTHKVHTKISDADYQVLVRICCEYGFKSIYQILQTLLKLFIRSTSQEYKEGNDDGIAVEITEIFDTLAEMERKPRIKEKVTNNNRKNYD